MDDDRIEVFLKHVLTLEGENSDSVREGIRVLLAICEKKFSNAETNRRMKGKAAHAARMLCRARVVEELHRRKGTSTAVHLKIVLSVIDGPALVPLRDE